MMSPQIYEHTIKVKVMEAMKTDLQSVFQELEENFTKI